MRKSHFNKQFLVLLGPIITSFFACSNEEIFLPKQLRVCALVLSLWSDLVKSLTITQALDYYVIIPFSVHYKSTTFCSDVSE